LILSLSGAAVESGYVLVAFLTIMNGYLRGRLTDDEDAVELLTTVRETAQVGKRLGVQRLTCTALAS
jgi:hydroxypyruvate isomerase